MAHKFISAPAVAVAVNPEDVPAVAVVLTAGSATATLTIKSAGSADLVLSALTGTSIVWPSAGGPALDRPKFKGPVTADLVGAGSSARLDW